MTVIRRFFQLLACDPFPLPRTAHSLTCPRVHANGHRDNSPVYFKDRTFKTPVLIQVLKSAGIDLTTSGVIKNRYLWRFLVSPTLRGPPSLASSTMTVVFPGDE